MDLFDFLRLVFLNTGMNNFNRKHGLRGGGSVRSIWHSDRNSREHNDYKARKLVSRAGFYVKASTAHSGVKPVFVQPGSLKVPGDLCWLEDGRNVSGEEMVEQLESFERQVAKAGGAMRIGGIKQNGGVYLRASSVDVLKRRTVALPPWFSYTYANYPDGKKKDLISRVVKIVKELAEERWPKVEFKAYSVHDDTSNLHVDVWGTELQKIRVADRGNVYKDAYVTKGACFTSGLVGPGVTYLQAKKDMGHKLHIVDEEILSAGLKQYASHCSSVKSKALPEVPAEITYSRRLDEKLTKIWTHPEYPNEKKSLYLDYCKRLDAWKYGLYDDLHKVTEERMELAEEKVKIASEKEALEEDKSRVAKKEADVFRFLQKKLEEISLREAELAEKREEVERILEAVSVNDKPSMDYLADCWEKTPTFKEVVRKIPKTTKRFLEKLEFIKQPNIVKMRREMEEIVDPGISRMGIGPPGNIG